MNDAITIFYYVFNKIYDFLFNQAAIETGVTVGWIFIVVNIFIMLISNILNVPEGDDRHHPRYSSKTERSHN